LLSGSSTQTRRRQRFLLAPMRNCCNLVVGFRDFGEGK
jgi:hypothetical protein